MFGLIKAIDNFDVSLNVQFSTYAVPMIIGEIRRYLRDNNPIRVSRSVRDLAYRALHISFQYRINDGKWNSTNEGANAVAFNKLKPGDYTLDRKSTRLNSSHVSESRMPSSA